MKQTGRVIGRKVVIDDIGTRTFFENRTKKPLPHRYNYVIYQDDNPELAIERDQYEKKLIQRYINFDKDSRVLDIGCGVGRWADEIVKYFEGKTRITGEYVGVDFSEKLLQLAKESLGSNERCRFLKGAFQELPDVLEREGAAGPYSHILINGVLMYINDTEVRTCLDNVDKYLDYGGIVYIKEPVGVQERFTLDRFYSEELSSEYSAIYRSLAEQTALFTEVFLQREYILIACAPTWPEDLENRKETLNYYWILQKKS